MQRHAIRSLAALTLIAGTISFAVAADAPDAALKAAVADKARPAADTARDQYRHPAETLAFWGLKPGQSVIEIAPGGGYWTWILAPYAMATGGSYATTMPDETNPKIPSRRASPSPPSRRVTPTKPSLARSAG